MIASNIATAAPNASKARYAGVTRIVARLRGRVREHALEIRAQFAGSRVALLAICLHRPIDDRINPGIQSRHTSRRIGESPARDLPREDVVERHADRIEIGPPIEFHVREVGFGCGKLRGADRHGSSRQLRGFSRHRAGQAEVGHLHLRPRSSTMMLAGLMSRWMNPLVCANSSASHTLIRIGSASSIGSDPRAESIACTSVPSTYSMTK